MARNRRKNNTLHFGSLAPWVVAVAFLGVTGLFYVGFKTQMHLTGNQIKILERELAELNTRNEVLRARISSLASRRELQRRLERGEISMIPITNDKIVRINERTAPSQAPEMRAVSNRGAVE